MEVHVSDSEGLEEAELDSVALEELVREGVAEPV